MGTAGVGWVSLMADRSSLISCSDCLLSVRPNMGCLGAHGPVPFLPSTPCLPWVSLVGKSMAQPFPQVIHEIFPNSSPGGIFFSEDTEGGPE